MHMHMHIYMHMHMHMCACACGMCMCMWRVACGVWHVHVCVCVCVWCRCVCVQCIVRACMSRSKIGMCSTPPPPSREATAATEEERLPRPSVATAWCAGLCSPSAPSEPSSTREEEEASGAPLIGGGKCGKASPSRRGAGASLKAGTVSERPALGPSTGLRPRALRPRAAACTTEAARVRLRVGVRLGLGLG